MSKKMMVTLMFSLLFGWELAYNVMLFVVAHKYEIWFETTRAMAIANTAVIFAICFMLWKMHHENYLRFDMVLVPAILFLVLIIKAIAFGMMMISLIKFVLPLNMKMALATYIIGEFVIGMGLYCIVTETPKFHRYEMVA